MIAAVLGLGMTAGAALLGACGAPAPPSPAPQPRATASSSATPQGLPPRVTERAPLTAAQRAWQAETRGSVRGAAAAYRSALDDESTGLLIARAAFASAANGESDHAAKLFDQALTKLEHESGASAKPSYTALEHLDWIDTWLDGRHALFIRHSTPLLIDARHGITRYISSVRYCFDLDAQRMGLEEQDRLSIFDLVSNERVASIASPKVAGCAHSRSGRHVSTVDEGSRVRVRDTDTVLLDVKMDGKHIPWLGFTRDDEWIVAVSRAKSDKSWHFEAWNIQRGASAIEPLVVDEGVTAWALSPSTRDVAFATNSGIQLRGGASATTKRLSTDAAEVYALSFDEAGTLLAARARENRKHVIRVYDVGTGKLVRTMPNFFGGRVSWQDESKLQRADVGATRVLDPRTGAELSSVPVANRTSDKAVLSPDGRFVARFEGGRLDLFHATTGQITLRSRTGESILGDGTDYGITALAFDDGGRLLVTGDSTGRIQVWDLESLTVAQLRKAPESIVALAVRGTTLIVAQGKSLEVGPLAAGTITRTMSQTSHIMKIALAPKRDRVVTADIYGKLRMWNAGNGKELTFKGKSSRFGPLTFTPDGRKLLVGAPPHAKKKGTLALLDANSGREIRRYDTGNTDDAAFVSKGSAFITRCSEERDPGMLPEGPLCRFPTGGGKPQLSDYTSLPLRTVLTSADGRRVALSASALGNPSVSLASTTSMEPIFEGSPLDDFVNERQGFGAALSDRWLAIGTSDGTVRLTDLERGGLRVVLVATEANAGFAATSPTDIAIVGQPVSIEPLRCVIGEWTFPFELCRARFATDVVVKTLAPKTGAATTPK